VHFKLPGRLEYETSHQINTFCRDGLVVVCRQCISIELVWCYT